MMILNRYKKFLIRFTCSFIVLMLSVCSFSFSSYASSRAVPYAEPSTSDNQGYLVIELVDSTGNTLFNTFFWSLNSYQSESLSMLLTINERSVQFESYFPTSLDCTALISAYWNSNDLSALYYANIDKGGLDYTYSYTSSYTIVGYNYKGNVDRLDNHIVGNSTPNLSFSSSLDSVLTRQIISSILDLKAQGVINNEELMDLIETFNTSVDNNLKVIIEKLQSLDLLDDLLTSLNEIKEQDGEILQSVKLLEFYLATYLVNSSNQLNAIFSLFSDFSNTWSDTLDSILDILHGSTITEEDKANMEDFKENSQLQGEELNDLNEQNKVDKEEVGDLSEKVEPPKEEDPPEEEPEEEKKVDFNQVIITVTGNEFVSQALITVLGIALISYVLFGKR